MTSWGTIRSFYQILFLMKYIQVCSSVVRKDKKENKLIQKRIFRHFFLRLIEIQWTPLTFQYYNIANFS